MKSFLNYLLLLGLIVGLASCGKDDDTDPTTEPTPETPSYEIPTSYNFDNVSYTGQTHRLAMMSEWKSYMTESRTSGVTLDANRMKAMYANAEGAGFSQDYTKQIKSKTFEAVQGAFEDLIDELATASQSTVPGENGVSGVIESLDGAKSYLIGEDGLDHAQIIEKGLMGACFYYQGTTVYLGSSRMDVDNTTVEAGKGTEMEHHWDESFGYVGVPIDFPTNTNGLLFWGNYSNKRNAVLNSNESLMNAFLKGRAAISNDDIATRDEAISEVRTEWEKIAVGSALHYLNSGMANFNDMALMGHGVSEAIGFIYGLQFNEAATITNGQVNELLTMVAGSSDFDNMNLYNTTAANLESARDMLASIYNMDAIKGDF